MNRRMIFIITIETRTKWIYQWITRIELIQFENFTVATPAPINQLNVTPVTPKASGASGTGYQWADIFMKLSQLTLFYILDTLEPYKDSNQERKTIPTVPNQGSQDIGIAQSRLATSEGGIGVAVWQADWELVLSETSKLLAENQ